MRPLKYLSICSGIEACSVAWQPLGWTAAGYSEIEPFPRAVLQERFGAVPVDWDYRYSPQSNMLPLFGDFTQIEGHHVGPIDLLAGGTPCQSFSIAGKRLGLDDPRGNLTLEVLALARRLRPRWLVWENVPGVLSDDEGRTMGTFIGFVGQLGYRGCYRVLDAQFVRVDGFGRAVPQRRRRVFFVGYLGDDSRAFPVLFEPESLRGHPAPRRQQGEGTTHDVAPSLVSSGWGVERGGETRGQDPVIAGNHCHEVAPTLNAAFGDKLGLEDQHINGGGACSLPPVSMCLTRGAMQRIDAESETLIPTTGAVFDVAHSLSAEGFDASEDGTGRGTSLVPIAFDCKGTEVQFATDGSHPTLRSMGHSNSHQNAGGHAAIAFDTTQITSAANYSNPQPGDPCHPLAAEAHPPAIAIQAGATRENPSSGPDGVGVQEGIGYTLEAHAEVQAVAFDMRGREGGAQFEGPHETANIRAASGGSSRSYLAQQWAVRRLTPRECERLQGFPDDWTLITYRGKTAADGPRYKAIGNSMACNVMRWIGMRIDWADSIARDGP